MSRGRISSSGSGGGNNKFDGGKQATTWRNACISVFVVCFVFFSSSLGSMQCNRMRLAASATHAKEPYNMNSNSMFVAGRCVLLTVFLVGAVKVFDEWPMRERRQCWRNQKIQNETNLTVF